MFVLLSQSAAPHRHDDTAPTAGTPQGHLLLSSLGFSSLGFPPSFLSSSSLVSPLNSSFGFIGSKRTDSEAHYRHRLDCTTTHPHTHTQTRIYLFFKNINVACGFSSLDQTTKGHGTIHLSQLISHNVIMYMFHCFLSNAFLPVLFLYGYSHMDNDLFLLCFLLCNFPACPCV